MNPFNTLNLLWVVWAVSWFAAAFWSERAAKRPARGRELLYRVVTIIGAFMLFVPTGRYIDQDGLWNLDRTAEWVLVACAFGGFAFCWWARIHLGRLWSGWVTRKADHHIVDTGPYAIVRHPIYTGLLFSALATAIFKETVLALAGVAIMALGFWIKARLEENFLKDELGAEAYDSYRRRVPMLVPFGPKAT